MTEPTAPELDPREELASLVGSARALLEQYEASGADALAAFDPAAVAAFLAGSAQPSARGGAASPAFRPPPGAGFSPAQPAPPRAEPQRAAPAQPASGRVDPPRFDPPRAAPTQSAAPRVDPPRFDPQRPPPAQAEPQRFGAQPVGSQSFGSQPLGSPQAAAPRAAPPPAAAPSQTPPLSPHHEVQRGHAPYHEDAPPYREPAPAAASGQLGIAAAAGPAVQASPDGDDRRMRLALVNEEVRPCTRCDLSQSRRQTVFARGNPFAELCFVGEGPGADEDAQGEPFVGKAGQLLDKMIAAMGYRRDEVYICNIVKCRPPDNRKPEPAEIEACSPYLRDQLGLVKPKVIVALGATAVTGLIGTTEGITRMRGKWKLYKGITPIMPTFHPAYLLRDPSKKREVWSDLQEVMKHLGRAPGKSGAGSGGRGDE